MPKVDLRTNYDRQTEQIAKDIKKRMVDADMTQSSLAAKANVDQSTVSRHLRDIDKAPLWAVREYARVLGMTLKIE